MELDHTVASAQFGNNSKGSSESWTFNFQQASWPHMFPWLRMHIDKVNARWRVTKNIITELIPCNFPQMVVQVRDLRTHGDTNKIAIWKTETLGSDHTSASVNLEIKTWGSSKPKAQVLNTSASFPAPSLPPIAFAHLATADCESGMQDAEWPKNLQPSQFLAILHWNLELAQILEAALNPKPLNISTSTLGPPLPLIALTYLPMQIDKVKCTMKSNQELNSSTALNPCNFSGDGSLENSEWGRNQRWHPPGRPSGGQVGWGGEELIPVQCQQSLYFGWASSSQTATDTDTHLK